MHDPHRLIRAWLPHLLLLGLIVLGVWVTVLVLQPLLVSLLLSAALASLTYPVLFRPTRRALHRLLGDRFGVGAQRQVAGILATLMVLILCVSPLLLLLIGALGSLSAVGEVVIGLATRDPKHLDTLLAVVRRTLHEFNSLYPQLSLEQQTVDSVILWLRMTIAESSQVGSHVVRFLFQGSGNVAQYVLALISMTFFYAQGPRLMASALELTPLTRTQTDDLQSHYQAFVRQLLTDTVALAVARGVILGTVAYLANPDFNPIIIMLLAGFLSLLPMVGFGLVWIPLVFLCWQQQKYSASIAIGLCGLVTGYGLLWLWQRLGHRVTARDSWVSFALFLGLVGGLLSFGIKGFVIGPMAVVFTATITRFLLPLYGVSTSDQVNEEMDQDILEPTTANAPEPDHPTSETSSGSPSDDRQQGR